jgi:hypothetical protein
MAGDWMDPKHTIDPNGPRYGTPVAESVLKNAGPYAITLSSLDLQGITPGEKTLTVNFDFKLSIQ